MMDPVHPGVLDGRGNDVLGHAVHLVAELAGLHRRPGGRESLVGPAAKQQRVARLQLAPLELRCFFAEELERPLARLLEDAVEVTYSVATSLMSALRFDVVWSCLPAR